MVSRLLQVKAQAKLDRLPTVADVVAQRALLRYLEADEIILRGKP